MIRNMLICERSAFCQDDTDIGCANDLQMKIELTDNKPVAKNYIGVSRPLIGKLKEYVEDLLNRRFIQKSRSPYSSPCVVVRKKDGTMRLCTDHRQFSNKTVADQHPIPCIQETLDRFAGQKWYLRPRKGLSPRFYAPKQSTVNSFCDSMGLVRVDQNSVWIKKCSERISEICGNSSG